MRAARQRVELADVAAVVTDASELALDALVDAAFAGRIADVEFQFTKARNAGTSPGAILFARRRHVSDAAQGAARHRRRRQSSMPRGRGMWLHFSRMPLAQAALERLVRARGSQARHRPGWRTRRCTRAAMPTSPTTDHATAADGDRDGGPPQG